jgi:serine/threonine protein kinase
MERKPGDQFGPYQLVSLIGKGGMGEVWKARDTRLHRDVAIKFCLSQFSDCFLREARAIASLNHPNICTLYDIGPDYLVMEYIDGSRPRGPLTTPEAVRLTLGIAAALEVAHGKGIIHRDLKPANVLVTQSGVKLLDFGLALVNDNAEANVNDVATALTAAGAMMGTIAYMAPEQAQGKPADARSDVFAFGLLLYELLSGRRAFQGDNPLATVAAILQSEPPALSASAATPVVTRCLKKDPAERFQTMAAVREALEQSQSAPAAAAPVSGTPAISVAPSIAVLPFANIGADKENEYFSDGLAEEILNALSQVEGLSVAARTSSFSFRGTGAELSEIAAKLRVANVLEGSVRRAGNRVRVTVQLVDARNGFHLWSERYDRQMEDIFEVQDEIARSIAERLKVTLGGGVKRSTNNLEAYELYLKGRHYWHQRSPSTLRVAIQCFEQAIQVDPPVRARLVRAGGLLRDTPGLRLGVGGGGAATRSGGHRASHDPGPVAVGSERLTRRLRVLFRA